jgi:hypothetical protein
MWGRKAAERIAALEAEVAKLKTLAAEEANYAQILLARCSDLAADLRAAQNALLVEAAQNGIREEAIAHVRDVIAGMGLCSRCDEDVHLNHGPDGCPDPGCVCLIRDSDPTHATGDVDG